MNFRCKLHLLSFLFLPICVLFITTFLLGYSEGPLPALTGGFREQTCHSCHGSFTLNEGRTLGGVFYVHGIPKTYDSGQTYPITVVIGHPGQSRWGFELSVRSADSGRQAGELTPVDETAQLKEQEGIQYIEHTFTGSRGNTVDGPVEFHFNWTAPAQPEGPVLFNAAGNAANNNGDTTGDYIYTAGAYSSPAGIAAPLTTRAPTERKAAYRLNTSSRLIHLPAPVNLNRGDTEIHIEHRFLQPLLDSRPGSAFGIDSGANINLGFNYALSDRLVVGVSRARFDFVTTPGVSSSPRIAFTGAYELQSKSDSFWRMSLVGGLEGQENFLRHYSGFLQLATSWDYRRLRTYVVPTVIFNSRRDENLETVLAPVISPADNHTFSLGVGTDLALHPRISLSGEYVPRLAGFGGFKNERAALSWGLKIRTFGHVFTIMLSNNRNFTPATYGVNAESNDFVLGFNIYRRR